MQPVELIIGLIALYPCQVAKDDKCLLANGVKYEDGDQWSEGQCMKCTCKVSSSLILKKN